ncbi:hypothetical protein D3C81_2151490 [compost metagenome]
MVVVELVITACGRSSARVSINWRFHSKQEGWLPSVAPNGHSFLVMLRTLKPLDLPMRSRAGSHWVACEPPTSATVVVAWVSP